VPVSAAFLVEGGVSAVAAPPSATVLAAAAAASRTARAGCGPRYDADLLVADGDPVADIGAWPGRRRCSQAGGARQEQPDGPARQT
jgi:imidazolonepropionase-like amidohydrolase